MKYFTYGRKKLEEINLVPVAVDHNNKIQCAKKDSMYLEKQGSLWGCNRNNYYSDWTALTFVMPFLVSNDTLVQGFEYELDFSNILVLNRDNYSQYMKNSSIDIEKVKTFDGILFTKDLVKNVKEFESYYFESIQIFNTRCIKEWNTVDMDHSYILSDEYKMYAHSITKSVIEAIKKSEVFKTISQLYSSGK